jgi:hypothetical protein
MVGSLVATSAVLAQAPTPAVDPRPPKPAGNLPAFAPSQVVVQGVAPQAAAKGAMQKASVPAKPAQKAVTKIEVVRVQAGAAVKAVAAGNLGPVIDQFNRQGRPCVRAELLFVRKTCQTSTEQLRTISHEAFDALKNVVTKLAEGQQRPRRVVLNGRIQNVQQPDGGKLLQDALAAVMKKNLTPDQWSRYQAEADKRALARKEIGIKYLLEALDRDLYLSDQQRDKVAESLAAHWDDGWGMYLEYVLQGNQFYPMAIDPYVSPILNEHQQKVWQSTQRVSGFWGFGAMLGGFMNDDDALEEELGEAKK